MPGSARLKLRRGRARGGRSRRRPIRADAAIVAVQQRQADGETGPAGARAPGLDVAAVAGGDRLDDREPEAGAVGGGGVGRAGAADEAGEELLAHVRWEAGAVVAHLQHRGAVSTCDGERDLGPGRGVAKTILEQVEGEAVELVGVAHDRDRAVLVEAED